MIVIPATYASGTKTPLRSLTPEELASVDGYPVYITETDYTYFQQGDESLPEYEVAENTASDP